MLLEGRLNAGRPLNAITNAGNVAGMPRERKITVHVPDDLLDRAQKATGEGITETIRQGLRLGAAGETFRRVSQLRGSVSFSLDLDRLREDRGDRR
jgi:hypothetical protein